jgi:hypothetical protein
MKPRHTLRQADPADVATISEIVRRAYEIYLPRMEKPPGPMLDDYAARILEGAAFVPATRKLMPPHPGLSPGRKGRSLATSQAAACRW